MRCSISTGKLRSQGLHVCQRRAASIVRVFSSIDNPRLHALPIHSGSYISIACLALTPVQCSHFHSSVSSHLVMPNKCCVAACKSGYDSQTEKNVSMFCFPYDPNMRRKWLTNLHRDDLKDVSDIKKSMRVCSKHFLPDDFENTPKLRKLKPSAWPRIHPNLPG